VFENWVQLELPVGKILICDVKNLYFVKFHNWCCSAYGYAVTTIDWAKHYFHNIFMKHIPSDITVDHCNLNKLDCQKADLRLVDKRTWSINRSIQANNKMGMTLHMAATAALE